MANKKYEAAFWKNEYELLRRKKNKEILNKQIQLLKFMDKTWKLLKELNIPDEVIFNYYKNEESDICQH